MDSVTIEERNAANGVNNEEVLVTMYALDKDIGVYKARGNTHESKPGVFFDDRGSMFVEGEWHRTDKAALAQVKVMAHKAMKRLMREHTHVKNIMLNARDGRLPASRKP
jgi:hypothetical protein